LDDDFTNRLAIPFEEPFVAVGVLACKKLAADEVGVFTHCKRLCCKRWADASAAFDTVNLPLDALLPGSVELLELGVGIAGRFDIFQVTVQRRWRHCLELVVLLGEKLEQGRRGQNDATRTEEVLGGLSLRYPVVNRL